MCTEIRTADSEPAAHYVKQARRQLKRLQRRWPNRSRKIYGCCRFAWAGRSLEPRPTCRPHAGSGGESSNSTATSAGPRRWSPRPAARWPPRRKPAQRIVSKSSIRDRRSSPRAPRKNRMVDRTKIKKKKNFLKIRRSFGRGFEDKRRIPPPETTRLSDHPPRGPQPDSAAVCPRWRRRARADRFDARPFSAFARGAGRRSTRSGCAGAGRHHPVRHPRPQGRAGQRFLQRSGHRAAGPADRQRSRARACWRSPTSASANTPTTATAA